MPKSLFDERSKNIFLSNVLLYAMAFLAIITPLVVHILSGNFIFSAFFVIISLAYLSSFFADFQTAVFSNMNAVKLDNSLSNISIASNVKKNDLDDVFKLRLKQFRNIVDEINIAAAYYKNIDLYLINHPSINAVSIARNGKAAIGITRGALEKLNREELSGVIGHEMSHLVNGDSELKYIAYIIFGALFAYSASMYYIIKTNIGSSRVKRINLLIIFVFTFIGYMLGTFMFFLISRKRELLADIEALRFTRDRCALINVFKKIKGNKILDVPDTMSALFFANPLSPEDSEIFLNFFRTHPTLEERIKNLEQLS